MAQVIIQGFLLSGLYALIAVGFTMIFSVGRVLNLAYGVYIMLGGYVYYVAVQMLSLPKFPSFLLAGLAGIVFGVLPYRSGDIHPDSGGSDAGCHYPDLLYRPQEHVAAGSRPVRGVWRIGTEEHSFCNGRELGGTGIIDGLYS